MNRANDPQCAWFAGVAFAYLFESVIIRAADNTPEACADHSRWRFRVGLLMLVLAVLSYLSR